jgi:cob(I)alamin adenosyltransferase
MTDGKFPWFTGKGDDGFTSLLGGERVMKDHPCPESCGTVDEACSMIGFARAMTGRQDIRETLIEVQRDLHRIMSEMATSPGCHIEYQKLDETRIHWLEEKIKVFGSMVKMPREFVLPGESMPGAVLDVARTVVRRAERRAFSLARSGFIQNRHITAYLNRLSSLCFTLARLEDASFDHGTNRSKGGNHV